jgi:integrase
VLPQANAYAMIGRRATAAGIETKLGNHSFRATGITAYLKNGGTLAPIITPWSPIARWGGRYAYARKGAEAARNRGSANQARRIRT